MVMISLSLNSADNIYVSLVSKAGIQASGRRLEPVIFCMLPFVVDGGQKVAADSVQCSVPLGFSKTARNL